MLAQGRHWRASLGKGSESVLFTVLRDTLPEALGEVRDLRIEAPIARWNSIVKNILSDRRLLGGILLDFAKAQEALTAAIADDRLFRDLQHVVLEATVSLVEQEVLELVPATRAEGS